MGKRENNELPAGVQYRAGRKLPYQWRFMYRGVVYCGDESTAKKAKKAMDERRYEVEHGLYEKEEKTLVKEWFPQWLSLYKTGIKPGTRIAYEQMFRLYIAPGIGSMRMRDVRLTQLQKILNDTAAGYSRSTLTMVKIVLNGMFKQAYKRGIISKNPMMNTDTPAARKSKKKGALTREQQTAFLQYAEKSEYYPLFRLATLTGMRIGELLGLSWDDVDFQNRTIHVRHTLTWSKAQGFSLGEPKTDAGMRDIPLLPDAAQMFHEQKTRQLTARMAQGAAWIGNGRDLVFTTATGQPVAAQWIDRTVRRISARMQKDGIELPAGFSFHTLRHCFATRCIEQNMNMKTLQMILGHSSLSITMDVYADVMPDTKQEEMMRVAAGL